MTQQEITEQQIFNEATTIYHDNLMSNERAINYLSNNRKLKTDILTKFKIGYAGSNNVISEKLQPKYNVSNQLVYINGDNRYKDFFHNRIIFPVIYKDNTTYFTSRDITDLSEKVHLHIASSHKHLYNHEILEYDIDGVFIVEGVIDCLTLLQNKINAVATYGTSGFRKKYANDFKKIKYINILYDNDNNKSGYNASIKTAVKIFEEIKVIPYIYTLPKDEFEKKMDINMFLQRYGNNAVRDFLFDNRNAIPADKFEDFNKVLLENKKLTNIINKSDNEQNIIDVISPYVSLYKNGNKLKGICPFHKETDASLVVYPATNTWWCFGCNTGHTANHFIYKLKEKGLDKL